MPSQGAGGGGGGRGGVDLEKRREKKKERKKQKQSSANSFSPTSRRDCPCLSVRKTYSFDHPILSPPFFLITASRMWYEEETRFHTGEKGREGEEKGGGKRHAFLCSPSYLSDVLTGGIKRSHETGKPQSANTPWGRHEYRRIGNRLALGIRRQLAATVYQFSSDIYPPAWNPAEILARRPARNPELTFSPSLSTSLQLSRYPFTAEPPLRS